MGKKFRWLDRLGLRKPLLVNKGIDKVEGFGHDHKKRGTSGEPRILGAEHTA